MNRIIVSAFIAMVAFATGAECNARPMSKCKAKKVNSYFSKALKGEEAG